MREQLWVNILHGFLQVLIYSEDLFSRIFRSNSLKGPFFQNFFFEPIALFGIIIGEYY